MIKSYFIPHESYELVAKMRKEGCLKSEESDENGSRVKGIRGGKLESELQRFVDS